MIVTCPACQTRYLVAEQALNQPGGRTVRCAGCGHRWQEPATVAQTRGEEPGPRAATRGLGSLDERPPYPESIGPTPVSPTPVGPTPVRPDPVRREPVDPGPARRDSEPARRRGWLRPALLALPLLIVAALLAALAARDEVAARWPPAARLYAMIGLPIEVLGAGLEIDAILPSRDVDGLVIEGEVVDTSGLAREVPRLRVALQDATQKEVQFKIIDPPRARLWPGEAVHFRTVFPHPDETATGVVVTFAAN